MKLKSHLAIFFILLIINFGICWFFITNSEFSNSAREMPEKIKFKSAQKEEALVIKTNQASGTTKLEICMNKNDGKLVNVELKAKVDPNNPKKLKYKVKEEDDKTTLVSVKYSDSDDDFKILDPKNDNLLYKIKFKDGKMKIGFDEECTVAYELKNTTESKKKKTVKKIKVYNREGLYVASVSKSSDSGKYKVKKILQNQEAKEDLYSTKDIKFLSYAVGVMGLEDIHPVLRAVIATEVLKKGR